MSAIYKTGLVSSTSTYTIPADVDTVSSSAIQEVVSESRFTNESKVREVLHKIKNAVTMLSSDKNAQVNRSIVQIEMYFDQHSQSDSQDNTERMKIALILSHFYFDNVESVMLYDVKDDASLDSWLTLADEFKAIIAVFLPFDADVDEFIEQFIVIETQRRLIEQGEKDLKVLHTLGEDLYSRANQVNAFMTSGFEDVKNVLVEDVTDRGIIAEALKVRVDQLNQNVTQMSVSMAENFARAEVMLTQTESLQKKIEQDAAQAQALLREF